LALVVAGRLTRTIKPDGSAPSDIYKKSSVDLVLRDSFRKMRHVLMTPKKLTDEEAVLLMTVAISSRVRRPASSRALAAGSGETNPAARVCRPNKYVE
jgi:acetamidase/formamidase